MASGTESTAVPVRRVLVVDDSLSVRNAVHQAFATSPHVEVNSCGDVTSAELLLRENSHDLVLCDVVLPGRPGYELCAQITGNGNPDRPLVYLLAGTFEPFDAERARSAGADAVITKPFQPAELRLRLEAVLAPSAQVAEDAPCSHDNDKDAITGEDIVAAPDVDTQQRTSEPADTPEHEPRQESAMDELVRRMLEPLSRQLVEPLTEAILARLTQPGGRLDAQAGTTLKQVAEELVSSRLRELEDDAGDRNGDDGTDLP